MTVPGKKHIILPRIWITPWLWNVITLNFRWGLGSKVLNYHEWPLPCHFKSAHKSIVNLKTTPLISPLPLAWNYCKWSLSAKTTQPQNWRSSLSDDVNDSESEVRKLSSPSGLLLSIIVSYFILLKIGVSVYWIMNRRHTYVFWIGVLLNGIQ